METIVNDTLPTPTGDPHLPSPPDPTTRSWDEVVARAEADRPFLDRFDAVPTWARVLIALTAGFVGFYPVVGLLFIGLITATGCFIECSNDPHPFIGAGIALTAAPIVGGWAALCSWAIGRQHAAKPTFLVVAALVVMATISMVLFG